MEITNDTTMEAMQASNAARLLRASLEDVPAPILPSAPASALAQRAAAVDALQTLGADYLTAARAVSHVLTAIEVERRM